MSEKGTCMTQAPSEAEIRADERRRIARHMKTIAGDTLRDPTSDAIDGYSAAVLLELAETIEKFEPDALQP